MTERLPMDMPEQRQQKRGEYVLDICIERGPHVTIQMSKLQAEASFNAIINAMGHSNDDGPIIRIDHDVGSTVVNADAILMVTIRPFEPQHDTVQHSEGAPVVMLRPNKPH